MFFILSLATYKMFFISKLCFLCLRENRKFVLIENKDGILTQKELKYFLPEIVDSHSKIPKYICSNCMSKLKYFYKFKQTCLRNNTYLKSYFQTLSFVEESYKQVSIKLTDIKYHNKLQAVNNDAISASIASDALRTGQKKDNMICNKKVSKKDTQCVAELNFKESHSLYDKGNSVSVKEEFLIYEDNTDIEFYHEYVKNIKCESIQSDSDVYVCVEDVHEDSKHSNSTSENNLTNPEANKVKGKKKILKNRKYTCKICKRVYFHRKSLEYHLKVHAGIKNFSCSTCQKQFMIKSNLTQHERIHKGIKNFECLTCNKKFMLKGHLTQHEKIHIGIRNYECSICKRKFLDKSNLVKHEKRHKDVLPYTVTSSLSVTDR